MIINNLKKSLAVLTLLIFNLPFIVNANYLLMGSVPDPMDSWAPSGYTGTVVDPINGEAPQDWLTAKNLGLPAYYVDSSHPAATNSGNLFGSPDKPRATILEGTYEAGSYVEIHGGPYDGGGQLIIEANGTPDKPVWIRGLNSDNRALISGETIVKGQYIILENLEYNTPRNTIAFRPHGGSSLHHAVVRNSVFHGDGELSGATSVIAIYGESPENRFHDIVVYNNEISQFGNDYDEVDPADGLSIENDFHGVQPQTNLDRVWIIKNNIHHLGGDSVQVGAPTADENRPSDVYIVDNDFYSNLENAIDIKASDNTLIIGNRMWDWKQHKDNSSTGSPIIIHNSSSNTWVVNNEISDGTGAVVVTGSSLDTWVVGNVIKDIKHATWDTSWDAGVFDAGAGVHFHGSSSGGIVNNTIISYDKGIEVTEGDYLITNNLLYNRNEKLGTDIWVESKGNFLLAKNLVNPNSFEANYYNVTCSSCISTPPSFADPDSVLVDDSYEGIGNGFPITSVLTLYTETFGTMLTKDIYGNTRIKDGIDIGAEESLFSAQNEIQIPLQPSIMGIEVTTPE
ncbi:MAG: hypothetical protein GY951_09240 [Psychromonas sp.]|nr:hypothetical protein [Psychromonas sp.]